MGIVPFALTYDRARIIRGKSCGDATMEVKCSCILPTDSPSGDPPLILLTLSSRDSMGVSSQNVGTL